MSSKKKNEITVRKHLTLKEKIDIVHMIENGAKQADVSKQKQIPKPTINKIWKNRIKLLSDFSSSPSANKHIKNLLYPKTDKALLLWMDSMNQQNIPINGIILQEKAKEFAKDLGENKLSASNGWIESWKKRHGIIFRAIVGEAAAVNISIVQNWLENVWPTLKEGYNEEDIYNGDETGLFYKLLPSKTMTRKGKKCSGGKLSKERISVLLCSNSTGTDKLKPLVIAKSKNPRCFKGVKKSSLPVEYYNNKKAWMTSEIFVDWLKKLNARMKRKNRKILLTIDNCPSHNVKLNLSNVKVVFFPPNVTSVLQPMDMGIINETKKVFRTLLVKKIIQRMEQQQQYQIDVLEGILLLGKSWDSIPSTTIQNCFYHSKIISRPVIEENSIEIAVEPFDMTAAATALNISQQVMEDYFSVDNQLMPYGVLTDQDIIEGLSPVENGENENSDGDDDPEINRRILNSNEVETNLEELKLWLITQDDDEDASIMKAFHKLEEFFQKSRIKNLKQLAIDKFVSRQIL